MGILFKKKNINQDKQISSGLYLGQKPEEGRKLTIAICLTRAVLVFFVVFGSLGGFLSAFQIEFSALTAGGCLLLCALYFGFLFSFKRKIWKDIGYILFFIIYVIGIFNFRTYANSGFAAIINAVRARGEVFFDLEAGMPFQELIENPFLTVTVIFVFIGVFEIIVLNIFVSGYMSLKLQVLAAFMMYGIPLYFRVEPDLPYVFCMLFGLAGIYMFKNNGKRVHIWALTAAFAMVVLVGICTLFFSNNEWTRRYEENEYKTATREGVSGFISLGFLIFFRDAYSSGGMNGGELGNISAIRPTGAVHLRVQYTPYDTSPVYLKAFTGFTYTHNAWKNRLLTDEKEGSSPGIYEELLTNQLKFLQEGYKEDKSRYARGLMRITNIAADEKYYYLPYISETQQEIKQGDTDTRLYFPAETTVEVPYYPMVAGTSGARAGILPTDYEVPAENWDAVSQACQEAGLVYGQEDAIEKVEAYLEEAYTYSYSPGRAPWGEDVINYFLQKNKKGVCAHFASAAALMLRRLGYPARYVEGYAIGYDDVLGGKPQEEEKYEDFYDGYSPLGKTAVMEVDVTDADAHAWVEVYDHRMGWRILDATPSSVETPAGSDFWRSLQGLLPDSEEADAADGDGISLGFMRSNKWRTAGTLLAIVIMVAVVFWYLSKYISRYRKLHSADRRANLLFAYRERCRKLAKKDAEFAKLSTPSQRIPYLAAISRGRHSTSGAAGLSDEEIVEKMEAACFGPEQPKDEDYQMLWRFLRGKKLPARQ